jgi:hypothetical protein
MIALTGEKPFGAMAVAFIDKFDDSRFIDSLYRK